MLRIVEFDRLVRSGGLPNCTTFAVDYEVSERTVARDIEYIRDCLSAPLEYDSDRRGYYYSNAWELPGLIKAAAAGENRFLYAVNIVKGLSSSEQQALIHMFTGACSSTDPEEEQAAGKRVTGDPARFQQPAFLVA